MQERYSSLGVTTDSVQLPKKHCTSGTGQEVRSASVFLQEKLRTQVSVKVNLKFKVKIAIVPQSPHSTVFSVPGKTFVSEGFSCKSEAKTLLCLQISISGNQSSSCHSVWIRDWVAFSVPFSVEKNVKINYSRRNKYFG